MITSTYYTIFEKYNQKRSIFEIYENIKGISTSMIADESTTLEKMVEDVRSIKFEDFINDNIKDAEKRNKEADKQFKLVKHKKKSKLPVFTPSMITLDEKRKDTKTPHDLKNFSSHTNIFSIDIDNLDIDSLDKLKNNLKSDPYVYFYFISPSKKGIKIFYIIDIEEEKLKDLQYCDTYHHNTFAYFESKFKIEGYEIDKSCKNINRLCYLSYDPDAFYNGECKVTNIPKSIVNNVEKSVVKKQQKIKKEQIELKGGDVILEEFIEWVEQTPELFNKVYDVYDEWIKLGLSLIHYFNNNEKALNYFLKLSSYSTKYDEEKTIEKFNNLSSNFDREKSPSIRFLFTSMKKYGFTFADKNDEKNYMGFNNTDIPYMLKEENIFIEQDLYTELSLLNVNNKKYQPYEDVYNMAINIIRERYGNDLNRIDIRNYIDDTRFYTIIDEFKPILEKYKTNDSTEYDKFFNSLKTNNDDVFKLLLTDWLFGVFDNVFTYNYYKFMFVIKGRSDVGKTYIINKMLSSFRKYITTDFNWRDGDKDNLQALCQYIFAYDDELSATTKSDIESLKKITSKSTIKVRPAYGRKVVERKRIASFIGSSNPDVFFKDDTGAIRFFAFELKSVDREMFNSIDFYSFWGYVWDLYQTKREEYVNYRNLYKNDINEDSRIISHTEEIIRMNYTITKGFYTRSSDIQAYFREMYKKEINSVELSKILKLCGYDKKRKGDGIFYNMRLKNATIDIFKDYDLEDLTNEEKKQIF